VNPWPEEKRYALVLAAGKSTRFKSVTPKVTYLLCGKPIISHVLDRLENLDIEKTFVVVGPESQSVKDAVASYPVAFVVQEEPLGTGHAVMAAAPLLKELSGSLLVLCGDAPLITTETLRQLLETREVEDADQVVLTATLEDPQGYGRIIRDRQGNAIDIVEEKEARPEQRAIREINTGFHCFKISSILEELSQLSPANATQEYYLTDLLRIFCGRGKKVATLATDDPDETRGINDLEQLALAERKLKDRQQTTDNRQ